jgi:ribosomal protein S12 methylthiotransferase accessory factor
VAPPIVVRGRLLSAAKRFMGTTQRVCSPAETLARILPLAPLAGVTRVADITGLDRLGVPVTLAIRPNARTLVGSSGKGTTEVAATVSGLMEAIEIYHAEYPLLEPESHTHRELVQAGAAVAPAGRLPLSRRAAFSSDLALDWVWGWDLIGQVEAPVPYSTVHLSERRLSFTGPVLRDSVFQGSSNGLASGNHALEAIAAALYEVIERDAVTLDRIREGLGAAPDPIDLDRLPWPAVAELVERCHAAGLVLHVSDITSDIGVPVYRAVLLDRQRHSGVYGGYGAHLDPEIATVRAITEAIQSRAVIIAGSRDDLFTLEHLRNRGLDDDRRFGERLLGQATARPPERESTAGDSFEADIAGVLTLLQAQGLDRAVVVDLGRPEFGLDVVRVQVPGLEGHAKFSFYAPGERARRVLGA